jgi:hypothetical protein
MATMLPLEPKLSRRPRWSLKSSFGFALGTAAVVVPSTLIFLRTSLWIELEAVAALLTLPWFLFLWSVFYRGVRFDKKERFAIAWRPCPPTGAGIPDASLYLSDVGCMTTGSGLFLDVIVSLLVTFSLAAALLFALWLGLSVLWVAFIVILTTAFAFWTRLLRYLAGRGRSCRGNLLLSMRTALLFSLAFSGWFYAVVYVAHVTVEHIQR